MASANDASFQTFEEQRLVKEALIRIRKSMWGSHFITIKVNLVTARS